MEKFVNILAEINKTREAIKAAKAKEDKLVDHYMSMSDLKERCEAKKATDDMIKISEKKQDLQRR